jgi:hypothetical protein
MRTPSVPVLAMRFVAKAKVFLLCRRLSTDIQIGTAGQIVEQGLAADPVADVGEQRADALRTIASWGSCLPCRRAVHLADQRRISSAVGIAGCFYF